ncbi:hypothetical protein [Microbacterium gorillae]|uniref:hypothetical protein n=1 Tax=Microbacterium gorillae TaxID=1231063 RepID=UPI003D996D21
MMPHQGAPAPGFSPGAPVDPRGSHQRPLIFGGPGLLSAPVKRRGPRGSTVATAIGTVLLVLAGCGGMWAASATARANMLPGAPVEEVATTLGEHLDADDDAWTDDLVPTLAAQFTAAGSRPGVGDEAALDALGVTRSTEITVAPWRADGDLLDKDRPADVSDAYLATTLTFADGSSTVLNAQGLFVRAFFYDGSSTPEQSRVGEDPTAVAPWALGSLVASHPQSSVVTENESCTDPMRAMVALSTVARTTGTLASTCALGGSDVAVAAGLDAAAVAASFPVLGDYSELAQIPALPGDPEDVGLVQYRFTAGEQNLVAVLVSTRDAGWAFVGIAGAQS